ncbi:cyd operon YbgE family protein [Vibrio quintilis]|uniref:Cyd operon protein YbgE n=1 Tax=Vibrio quintilis TaxID=1117707 RepID=A0A1M7Z1T3_9VIBR|nr:cyd operon YbgE family protein [Vibrio quintilis]SHO58843.1 hypothetical protein VQ7734_04615 [Vibrio quintilis]
MKSELYDTLEKWHRPLDKLVFRLMIMGLGFFHVSLLMWNPHTYADSVGGFNLTVTVFLIWSVCASMVFGVGFKPESVIWKVIFSPYISGLILFTFTVMRLI